MRRPIAASNRSSSRTSTAALRSSRHKPTAPFVKLAGLELELVLSNRHQRAVRNGNTVTVKNLILQLPPSTRRRHFARRPVIVHQFSDPTAWQSAIRAVCWLASRPTAHPRRAGRNSREQ